MLELIAGEKQCGTIGIEAAGIGIVWKNAGFDADPEKIFDRVLIFAAVEAAHRDDSAGVAEELPCDDEFPGEVGEKGRLFVETELRLFLRRHLAGVHDVQDLLPGFCGLHRLERKGESFEINAALFGERVMTLEAVFIEDRKVGFGDNGTLFL